MKTIRILKCFVVLILLLLASQAGLTDPIHNSDGAERPSMTAAGTSSGRADLSARPRVFTVNSSGDEPDCNIGDGICSDGDWDLVTNTCVLNNVCSINGALMEAQAGSDIAQINFSVTRIQPKWVATIMKPVVIDGTSAGMVEIDGSQAKTKNPYGLLQVFTNGVVIRGLVINRFQGFEGGHGIFIMGSDNVIQGNYIGTDRTGSKAMGNRENGIFILRGNNNLIGGDTPSERNVIAGNGKYGIQVLEGSGNQIKGNFIGSDKLGTKDLGNDGGISLEESSGNTIGGLQDAVGNLIAFSQNLSGVVVVGNRVTGNAILGNAIYKNLPLNIDLGGNGPTTNDAGDGDSGPNQLQNYPVLASVAQMEKHIEVAGFLNSNPDSRYRIEFFAGPQCTADGLGQGKRKLGSAEVSTDADGLAPIETILEEQIAGGVISATATNLVTRDTSEFSPCAAILCVNSDRDLPDTNPGDAVCSTGSLKGPYPECTLRAALMEANALAGKNRITYRVQETDMPVIRLDSVLPEIIDPVDLDGTTQPGSHLVSLTQGSITREQRTSREEAYGLKVVAGDSRITGHVITNIVGHGIVLEGGNGNEVVGNHIGIRPNGDMLDGNTGNGIFIRNSSDNIIGGLNVTTGKDCVGDCNHIAHNIKSGIAIQSGKNNAVLGNSIHHNLGSGIDLGNNGFTPNEENETDGWQNFPVITDIGLHWAPPGGIPNTYVTGILKSQGNAKYRVEFFNENIKGGVHPAQGRYLVGSTEVKTDPTGFGRFHYPTPYDLQFATATATRLKPDGTPAATSEFTPLDFKVLALEVTQAVQRPASSVSLVSQKTTRAIVHVRTLGPLEAEVLPIPQIRLTCLRNGVKYKSIEKNYTAIIRRHPKRKPDTGQPFYFDLPNDWHLGTGITLEAEINYAINGKRPIVESDYTNNMVETDLNFEAERWMRVWIFTISWQEIGGGSWHTVPAGTIAKIQATLKAAWPKSTFRFKRIRILKGTLSGPPLMQLIHLVLMQLHSQLKELNQLHYPRTIFLGLVPGRTGGLTVNPRVTNAFPPAAVCGTDKATDLCVLHEFGHLYGRFHTCTPNGNEPDCDEKYPYPEGRLTNPIPKKPLAHFAPTVHYGYHSGTGEYMPGDQTWDIMSYKSLQIEHGAQPPQWVWISDYTWNGIRTWPYLDRRKAQKDHQGRVDEALVVAGIVDRKNNTVELLPFFRHKDYPLSAPVLESDEQYYLRLRDSVGTELATYPLHTGELWMDPPGDSDDLFFREVVRFVKGTARIEVVHNENVLAFREVSSASPQITLIRPRASEVLSGTTDIKWSVTDPDKRGEFKSLVLYSPDNGTNWQPLAFDWPETSLEVNTDDLPASSAARLQILVTDGVNTGKLTSDPFVVKGAVNP